MISTRPFGRTGFDSARILFGVAALAGMRPARVEATLEILERYGVNHIDTAISYGDSELNLAGWLAGHRSEVFLATKTHEREGQRARASLEACARASGVMGPVPRRRLLEQLERRPDPRADPAGGRGPGRHGRPTDRCADAGGPGCPGDRTALRAGCERFDLVINRWFAPTATQSSGASGQSGQSRPTRRLHFGARRST